MKLTNILLILLIGLVAFQKLPLKEEKTVSKKETPTVKIKKQYTKTKSIKVESKDETPTKHSTSFRLYTDTEGRSNQRINHRVRIGKDYYLTGGVYLRQNDYRNSAGVDVSITKYW